MNTSRYTLVFAVIAALVIGFALGNAATPASATSAPLACARRAGVELDYAYHHQVFKRGGNRLRCVYHYVGVIVPPVTEGAPTPVALVRRQSSLTDALRPPESTAEATP